MPVVGGAWFLLRPLDLPPDWLEVSLAAVYLSGAIVGYIFIRRVASTALHLGWTLFSLQIVVDFCDEFTKNQHWDTVAQSAFGVSGCLVLAYGVARSQASLESEAEGFRRREEQLRFDAYHDQLTGLANRTFFQEELALRWGRLPPEARDSIAVLFLDLDNFKRVNDELGHLAGDELLREVGRRLKEALRGDDVVARVGGDEFAALLSGVADDEKLERVLARVRERLAESVSISGVPVSPQASIGVSRGGPDREKPKDLLRAADTAMYVAKRAAASRRAES